MAQTTYTKPAKGDWMIEYENEKLVRCSIAVVLESKNKFKPTRIATVAKENY